MSISRREVLSMGVVAGVAALSENTLSAGEASGAPVEKLESAIIVDACGGPGSYNSEPGAAFTEAMIQDIRASGLTCVSVTVGPVGNRPATEAFEGIFRDIGLLESEVDHHPDVLCKVKRFEDIASAKSLHKMGIVYALQDGVAFEDDLERLLLLYRFGVRIIQPTYNLRNLLGDGCLEPANAGLSKAGRIAVSKMNELGILVDLSHCGKQTTADAMEVSTRPVAFTHTGCAAVYDHPRNKTDEQLKALADKGGVAGIYFMPYLRPSGQPMAEDVIRHVEHAIRVAGEDHVGIGTDGVVSALELTPEYVKVHKDEVAARKKAGIGAAGESEDVYLYIPDLNTPHRIGLLGDLLLKRGYSSAQVEKLLGSNFARLFHDVW